MKTFLHAGVMRKLWALLKSFLKQNLNALPKLFGKSKYRYMALMESINSFIKPMLGSYAWLWAGRQSPKTGNN